MGRYYSTNRFSGKFGFAIQSSDDPELFGMQEQPPAEINYYLEAGDNNENTEEVAKVMDAQYDILEIPKEERVYLLQAGEKAEQPLIDLEKKYYEKHYRPYDKEKDKSIIPYHSSKYESGAVPTKEGIDLAWCRVWLGAKIYTDLVLDGYCDLNAEV